MDWWYSLGPFIGQEAGGGAVQLRGMVADGVGAIDGVGFGD
jgi:hypothetical protein